MGTDQPTSTMQTITAPRAGTAPSRSALSYAQDYLARGWQPVPIPSRSKRPITPGWARRRFTELELPTAFNELTLNIGVLLGEPSENLADIDLDCVETLALAPSFLPPTQACFGRKSKPRSHYLYTTNAPVKPMKFSDPVHQPRGGRAVLLELRSTGQQTLFPGSVHPSGEPIEWAENGPPAIVPADDLCKMVTYLAIAALLTRYWPSKGGRHDVALAAAGLLLRARADLEWAARIVGAAARAAGDEQAVGRIRDVIDTARRLVHGKRATGGPRLEELLGEHGPLVVATIRKWLRVFQDDNQENIPDINAGDYSLPRVAQAAWNALRTANSPPRLFRYGQVLVQVITDDRGQAALRPLSPDRLRYRLARAARWYTPHGKQGTRRPALPPIHVCRDLLAADDPPLPKLERLVECPVFTHSGSILRQPGYDPESRLLYASGVAVPLADIPERPLPADLQNARNLILDELLGDFPFVGDAERAHAVSLLLLSFCRDLVDGPTPLYLIEKPSPGTGATLLAEVLLFPALGRPVPTMSEARDEEEWRKRITAKLLSDPGIILVDNLRRRLDSSAVATAITSPEWEDRVLGHTETTRVPVRCIWLATANNPMLSAEIARRTVRVRLDAKVDRPWCRTGFRHSNLPGWVRDQRAQLVWAALVLGQAWLAAGRPRGTASFGGFESWSEVLGGILAHAAIPGFLSNLDDFYETADAEGTEIRAFLNLWWIHHKGAPVKVAELYALASGPDSTLDIEAKSDQGRRVRLGKLLDRLRDCRYQIGPRLHVRVDRRGRDGHAVRWGLTPIVSGEMGSEESRESHESPT